jgi:hypothetical protein
VILRVVDKALAARGGGVAVTVISFAGQLIVGVVGEIAGVEARERRCLRGPVADRVEIIADAAILVRRIVRDRFAERLELL